MTISKASGLSFTEIKSEFGGDGDPSLSEYYLNGSYVTSNNTSVPTSGGGRSISFSQFHGAIKALLVEYQIIGGGGGGGYGKDNYLGSGSASSGGSSSVSGPGFTTVTSTGGSGGANATSYSQLGGQAGASSHYGAGGARVGGKVAANNAPSSSYGAGGGGAGGDSAGDYGQDGGGGFGGGASSLRTGNVGVVPVGSTINVTVGSGGAGGVGGNRNGGRGANGYVRIRKNGGSWTNFTSSGSYTV